MPNFTPIKPDKLYKEAETPKKKTCDLRIMDGFYFDVPDEFYHSLSLYTSSHSSNPDKPDKDISQIPAVQKAFRVGTAIHSLVLEGDTTSFTALPHSSEKQTSIDCLKAIKNDPEACKLLENICPEVVAICNNFLGSNVPARGKLDAINFETQTFIDLKTVSCMDKFCLKSYHWQLSYYRLLLKQLAPPEGEKKHWSTRVLVVEKKSPFRVKILRPRYADLSVKELIIKKYLFNQT